MRMHRSARVSSLAWISPCRQWRVRAFSSKAGSSDHAASNKDEADVYVAESGRVMLSGMQALVKVPSNPQPAQRAKRHLISLAYVSTVPFRFLSSWGTETLREATTPVASSQDTVGRRWGRSINIFGRPPNT